LRIPLFRPVLSEEAIEAAAEVLRSGWLGLGPKTQAFEEAFALYVGAPYCVGLTSCTSALHLGLLLLGLPPGTEVITTALTFVATNHAILYARCKPVFADIQPDTGNLDVTSVSKRLSERTGAILIVHFGGYPCDLDEFYSLARARGIPIIEDCAHAVGALYKGRRIGSHGELHAFSFNPVKNLPMAEGGALTVRSLEYDERLRRLRWFGVDRDTFLRVGAQGYSWEYDVVEVGFRYAMNDVQAAIGLAQLPRLDQENDRRREIAHQYQSRLARVPGLELLRPQEDRVSSHHLFCILAEGRNALVEKLRSAGVDVGVHYKRCDQYRMYEEQDLHNTERFCKRALSLPMHLGLNEEHIEYITDTIRAGW
jgi:perosamine synthetase